VKQLKKLSIVIPVYNSEKIIEEVVNEIEIAVSKLNSKYDLEIILVNDYSKDNSLEVCKNICKHKSFVKLISFSKNFGQHNALMAGIKMASGDYIISMDDDLQTPPAEMGKLIDELEKNNYDVVFSKYKTENKPIFRNFGSFINSKMANILMEKPKNITTNSYFIMKKYIAKEIIKYEHAYPYIVGLIFRVTQNVGNVLIEHRDRKIGKSNYTLKKLLQLWFNGFTDFSVKPLRISSIFGLFLSITGFVYLLIIIIRKIINPGIPAGWTSIIAAIIFFGGVQLLSIGLLGEYIGRLFLSINKKPQYVIKEKYSIDKAKSKNDNN
jgi:undecaprenyl-phosphate 4-deoxy-4-formamido-L-arabinose transferase